MLFPRALSTAAVFASLVLAARDNCTEFASPSAGERCLDRPSDCTATYLVQPDDTCYSIASQFANFTISVFTYWNPDVGPSCLSIQAYTPVCIATPWYTFSPPIQQAVGTIEFPSQQSAIDQPRPLAVATDEACQAYELAGTDVYEFQMASAYNLTFDEFESLNPSIHTFNGTQAGYWYCVLP